MLALIGAMSQNRIIGNHNQLPWRLPADLHYFKTITTGQTVVMGRKTFESIGHALPGRRNIVLTRQPDFQVSNIAIAHSLTSVLKVATAETVFIIGGSSIYRQFLPYAQRIYLTLIEAFFDGDAFFPELDTSWQLFSQTLGNPDQNNPYPHRFLIYEKKLE